MIALSNIIIRYGGKALFDNLTATVGPKDRIGLVGKNGAGKSTLMKIIAGLIQADEGDMITPNGYRIGYLPQEGIVAKGKTAYEEVASSVFGHLIKLDEEIHHISDELTVRTDYESDEYTELLHRLGDANDIFHREGGMTIRARVEEVLSGLGFSAESSNQRTDDFSGGWQMRIELAKILLQKPDCILLDEPTNHLDIESIQWLEAILSQYEGSVMLISHDRTFLDAVTNRTMEITGGKIEDYKVSYSHYVQQRLERRMLLESSYNNQQREIEKQEKFIERFRSKSSLATRVQSRIKQLDKIERIEIEHEDTSVMTLRFPPAPRSGIIVAECKDLTKRFGEKTILRSVNLTIERGEKVAFVGKNGEGKTTLSKIIAGKEPYEGGCTIGYNVHTGYFEQHQAESLDSTATVFDIIDNAASGDMRLQVRNLLGAFLFSGDSVNKKVRVLSGGEKSRLAMAKLLLEPINLLILDEPTNHLDMRSKDMLKRALQEYDGAMIIVSHDREFLSGLTNKVIEFRGGGLKEYIGDIHEYLKARNIESLRELELRKKTVQEDKTATEPIQNSPSATVQTTAKSPINSAASSGAKTNVTTNSTNGQTSNQSKQITRDEQKQRIKEERKIKKDIEDVELLIASKEAEIERLETEMADPGFYQLSTSQTSLTQYTNTKEELVLLMKRWEKLHIELEAVVL